MLSLFPISTCQIRVPAHIILNGRTQTEFIRARNSPEGTKGWPPLLGLCDLHRSLLWAKKRKCFDINSTDVFESSPKVPMYLLRVCIPFTTVTKGFAEDHTPGC